MALANRFQFTALVAATLALVFISARIEWLHWLTFIWLLPLAFILPKASVKQATWLSVFTATAVWIISMYWLIEANMYFAESAFIAVAIVFLLFCLWQALPYIVLGVCYSYFNWRQSYLGPLLAAATLSVAWSLQPTPLPWLPQNFLFAYPKFIAVLDLSGISLLLFLSTLFCFSIEYISRKDLPYKKHYVALALSIPLLMLAYGQVRQLQLDNNKAQASAEQWLNIGYIQPALNYEEPFDRAYQVTEQLIKEKKPDLIVWPEIASPYSFIDNLNDRRKTLDLVRKHHQDIITVSGYVYTKEQTPGQPYTYYNQAQLIKNYRLQGQYSKEILVPFFEYMPKPLSFLRRWMPRTLYYQAGESQQLLNYKNDIKLLIAICYEVIFPEYVRKQVKQGGNIIINPTSDAVFGGGIGGYYHLATAYFRSIENRVPWVRPTNTGISIIVDADGSALSKASDNNVITSDSAKVFIPNKTSFYSVAGDWFSKLLVLVMLLYPLIRKQSQLTIKDEQ